MAILPLRKLDAVDLRAEADELREALQRLSAWGGMMGANYSGSIVSDVLVWFRYGAKPGQLPLLPEWADANGQHKG